MNEIEILLPANIPVDDVLSEFGRITGERLLLMLSYIYGVGFWKYRFKDANFQVSSDVLVMLGGNKQVHSKSTNIKKNGEKRGRKMYLILLEYAIEERKWIERDDSYKVGEYSKSFRYRNRDETFLHQQRYFLTSKNAIKAYNKLIDRNKMAFAEKSVCHKKIQDSVMSLTFDEMEAFNWVMSLSDGAKKNNLFIGLYHFRSSKQLWKTDKNGRVYTWPVILPKELRKFIKYSGNDLWQLDVSHCHPLLHTIIYPDDEECGETYLEKKKYQAFCEQGMLYSFIGSKMKHKLDLGDEDQKRMLKETIFHQVFYGHPDSPMGEIGKIFSEEFPYLWKTMCKMKTPNHRHLPNIMMNLESEIFVGAVVERLLQIPNQTFPIVTIHDCILTTSDGVGYVRSAIEEEFKSIFMNPMIKEEKI